MTGETRDLADEDPALIRAEIDETRSAITTKLEALEQQVVCTVQDAKDTVQETIENVKETVEETVCTVKETVQDTVSTVKETFDLKGHVQRHPWPMVGGAWVAGLVAGAVLGEAQHRRRMPMDRLRSRGEPMNDYRSPPPSPAPPDARSGFADTAQSREPGLLDRFHGEIEQVKGLAIGMALGAVRDVIKQNLPQFEQQVGEVMDSITTKLGGQPIRGRVLESNPFEHRSTCSAR